MQTTVNQAPRARLIDLPGRGGAMGAYDFGDSSRPVDVVFIHANGFNARTYTSILAPLAEDLRILAVDQRGHGRSTLPAHIEGRTSWHGLRDDLLALLETLGDGKVVLGGHSMGGTVGVLAQAVDDRRIRRLVLNDPVVMSPDADRSAAGESPLVKGALRRRAVFPDREMVITGYTGRGAFRTWTDQMLSDYVADGFRDRPDGEVELSCSPAWEASNFTSHEHDTMAAFEAAKVPIRILRAEDGSTCRDNARLTALVEAGRVRMETVPGTTHFLPMERPDLVRETLLEAVREA